MTSIPATHIKTGHAGEVQQTMNEDGVTLYYFEDDARPTAAGWHPSSALVIPGVNA